MKFLTLVWIVFLALLSLAVGVPVNTENLVDLGCSAPSPLPGVGEAVVVNNCVYNVYLQSVAGIEIDPVVTLEPGTDYSEQYRTGPNGAGVAIKITDNSANWTTPMLLEYSPNSGLDMVFYDMSVSVGGEKQGTGGIGDAYELLPSIINASVDCVAVSYNDSYVNPGEGDDATKSCPLSTTITLTLC